MNIRPVKLFVISIFAVIFLYNQFAFSEGSSEGTDTSKNADYLRSMMDMVKKEYKGDINDKKLMEGALKGLYSTMDRYTEFYTPEEAESFLNTIDGAYEGIGITLTEENDNIVVEDTYPDSPASKAGICAGDRIVEIDGKSLSEKSLEDAVNLLRGAASTKVNIGIVRDGENDVTKVEVTREKVSINPVSYKITGDIGYIKLDIFNMNLDNFLTKTLSEMDSKNIKKIILDLRDNPGGEVDQAVAVAKKFVPAGLITKLDFNSEDRADLEYYSDLKEEKYKIAVLVNKNSASASEILAGAIQDTGAGTLIGTKTFGKAKVQNLYPLLTPEAFSKYKSQLGVNLVNAFDLESKYKISPKDDEIIGWTKITTGLYTTPKGRMIDTVGLTPDILIENSQQINNINIESVKKLKKKLKPVLNSESTDIENAEKILKMCGYELGSPDKKLDEKTIKALKKFQKDCGLFSYGMLDFATQQALNDKLEKLSLQSDKQYLKAVEILEK